MAHVEADTVQSGWSVWTSDGKEVGRVIGVEPATIRIRTAGILGHEVTVPKEAVDEVETGRVDLGLTKAEVEKG
jgi:hypothetical protein